MTSKPSIPPLSIESYDARTRNTDQIEKAFRLVKDGKPLAHGLDIYCQKLETLVIQFNKDMEEVQHRTKRGEGIDPKLDSRMRAHRGVLTGLIAQGEAIRAITKKTQAAAEASQICPSLAETLKTMPLKTKSASIKSSAPSSAPPVIPKLQPGDAPLHEAVRNGDRKLVIQLRLQGQSPWVLNAQGLSALHEAILQQDEEIYLDLLFPEWRVSPEKWEQFLVRKNEMAAHMDLLSSVNPDHLSPVCLAAYGEDDLETLQIATDAELNTPDKSGRTALHYALLSGNEPAVAYLSKRCDLKFLTRSRYSYGDYAILSGNPRIYQAFKKLELPCELVNKKEKDSELRVLDDRGILRPMITAEAAAKDPVRLNAIETYTAYGNALWLGLSLFSYLDVIPNKLASVIGTPEGDSWSIGQMVQRSAHTLCSTAGWATREAWNIPYTITHHVFSIPRLFDEGVLPNAFQKAYSLISRSYSVIQSGSVLASSPLWFGSAALAKLTGYQLPFIHPSGLFLAPVFWLASYLGFSPSLTLPVAWWVGCKSILESLRPYLPAQNYLPAPDSINSTFAAVGNLYALLRIVGATKVAFSQLKIYWTANKRRANDARINLGMSLFNLGAQIYVTYQSIMVPKIPTTV